MWKRGERFAEAKGHFLRTPCSHPPGACPGHLDSCLSGTVPYFLGTSLQLEWEGSLPPVSNGKGPPGSTLIDSHSCSKPGPHKGSPRRRTLASQSQRQLKQGG